MTELHNKTRLRRFEFADEGADKGAVHLRIKSFAKMSTVSSSVPLSNALDQFSSQYDANQLIQPLYNPAILSRFTINCDVMAQCVKAMKVNIDGMGWQVEFVPTVEQPDAEPSTADDAERRRLQLLFDYPNAHDSWVNIKMNLRADKCLTGYADLEVVRNIGDEIAELHYVPSNTIRLTARQTTLTEHVQWLRDGAEWIQIKRLTKFRRFLQMVNDQKVWFKEFGDPRSLNKTTGEYATDGSRWPVGTEATEIIHLADDVQNSVYGEPPWLSELMNIMGSTEAKKVNYLYFDNKTIPPFIITVSGGELNGNSEKELADYLDQHFKGSDNFHKVLLLEAVGTGGGPLGDEKAPAVRIDVKPMTEFLQQDALFQEYIKSNAKAIRESYRLPPLLIGAAEEYSHAAAIEAKIVAEQQVFQPERTAFDEKINRTIIADMGVQRWRMKSRGTPTADDANIITAMSQMQDVVPVGYAVDWISELMGKEPPKLDESIRNMLLGEFKSTYAPPPMFGGFGQEQEPPDTNAATAEEKGKRQEQVQKSAIVGILKRLRDFLSKHKAA